MTKEPGTRRQFLRGAGGVTLALPFLPSLLPRNAAAQPAGPPRIVLIAQVGGSYYGNFHGNPALPNSMSLYNDHGINWGPLAGIAASNNDPNSGRTKISPILNAPSTLLTPRLLSKMNVLRGIDVVSTTGHIPAAFGNVGKFGNDVCSLRNCYLPPVVVPSIDQLAAWSPRYNKTGRSLQTGPGSTQSWYHNTGNSGYLGPIMPEADPNRLFNRLFMGFNFTPPLPPLPVGRPPGRKLLVDHLLESYRNLRGSDGLSTLDRQRLDRHMESMAELQKRLNAVAMQPGGGPAGQGCSKLSVSNAPTDESVARFQTMNDIISTAFKCGLSRIATITTTYGQGTFDSSLDGLPPRQWDDACHQVSPTPGLGATRHTNVYQKLFEKVVLDLASKLDNDVDTADGRTYLDNTLLIFINSEGVKTHSGLDLAIATFGGAGGTIRTGNFIDYRNRTKVIGGTAAGLWANQFWSTVLGALGVPRADWERYGTSGKGYGPLEINQPFSGATQGYTVTAGHYVPEVRDNSGAPLPIFAM